MFNRLNGSRLTQCIVIHRKHIKRRLIDNIEIKRHFSNGKFSKLGDLYARLGLTGEVSQDDIKNAYYDLSKEHHPDRNKGCSVAAEKFRSISEAYEILGNVSSRAEYDRETPYARRQSRPRRTYQQTYESNSAFHEKDDELAEKIREFRKNMRKKTKQSSKEYEEYVYRRENVFDFDAWYRAHFKDDFETNLRKERIRQYDEQYRDQIERIMRGGRIRPPRPYLERKDPSDIEIQMEEMYRKELRKDIANTLTLGVISLFGIFLVICIIFENNTMKGPYVDPYAKKDDKENMSTENK